MGKKKQKHKTKKIHHTPLAQHQKQGTVLRSPLSELNMLLVDWQRDLLPEFLWIGSLAETYGIDSFHVYYKSFCDVLDEYYPESSKSPFVGIISDFKEIPEELRAEISSKHKELIREVFLKPFGRIIAFYPEAPCSWLVNPDWLSQSGTLDPQLELSKLRRLVMKLMDGKDAYSGRIRAIPLSRMLKHNKVFFDSNLQVVDLLPKYPLGLTREEQYLVESTARQFFNVNVQVGQSSFDYKWSQYFWRHNFDIVNCKSKGIGFKAGTPIENSLAKEIESAMEYNSQAAKDYMLLLRKRIQIDLYDPKRDEVLFGLFSRITRLLCLFYQDPMLWSRDSGSIMLRCLVDTAITFSYLCIKGTKEDFENFIKYGEGQQKLLMLQLQDNYPDSESLDGLSYEDISNEMGGFLPEIIDIELGSWSKKDTRKLAIEAGLEKFYRLIYTPTSSDVHGTWISLKYSNFEYCIEPLHRFHRLPNYYEPPFYINYAIVAKDIYQACLDIAIKYLKYPEPEYKLREICLNPAE